MGVGVLIAGSGADTGNIVSTLSEKSKSGGNGVKLLDG
jgi:hypothetical protein